MSFDMENNVRDFGKYTVVASKNEKKVMFHFASSSNNKVECYCLMWTIIYLTLEIALPYKRNIIY